MKLRLLSLVFFIFSSLSYANVVIDTTRVIYPSNRNEVSVSISNDKEIPFLVQSWIDDGDIKSNPSEITTPFVLTPPINRIDGKKSQRLRIFYNGEGLDNDRESVFWLNVLAVPAKNKDTENYLQLAYRTRIKLFFRPEGLSGNPNLAFEQLTWVRDGSELKVSNPTPYFISISDAYLVSDGNVYTANADMLSPYSSANFSFPEIKESDRLKGKLTAKVIDDFGAFREFDWTIK